jgi:hypothetical protein
MTAAGMALVAVALVAAGNLTWRPLSKGRYPSPWSPGLIAAGAVLTDGHPWWTAACWVLALPGAGAAVAAARGRRKEATGA